MRHGAAPRILLIGLLVAVAGGAVLVLLGLPLGRAGPEQLVVGGTPLYGKPAPEIDLPGLDGGRVRLSDLRGRPVLVNFWASWCIPCREEFPLLAAAYAHHREDGLEILGIVHDDVPADARRFAREYGATWPLLDDADDVAWRDYLGVGMPQSYFIDPDGVVRAFSLGGFTEAGLAAQLALILPPGASPAPPRMSLPPRTSPSGPPAPPASAPPRPATSDR